MISQDLSLAQLFPVESIYPIDLPAVAKLNPSALGETTPPAVARVLNIFADIMRTNHLLPVLCELAVISDAAEYSPVKSTSGKHFVSLINTYSDFINKEDAGAIAGAWVNAIAALPPRETRVPKLDLSLPDSGFIVLNEKVYDTLSFRRSMRMTDRKSRKLTAGAIALPTVKKFGFEKNGSGNPSPHTDRSITSLIRNTARNLSGSARRELENCFLVIVPFSRPYVDADDFDPLHRAAILRDQTDGDLLATYPGPSKDPGGCFFGIYHAPGLKPKEVHETERRFFLQVQYLLTLSAFVEARRNLLLYYDDQFKKDWSFLLHSVKHDLMTPTRVIKERARAEPEATDLKFAAQRMEMLRTLANLSSAVVETRAKPQMLMRYGTADEIRRTISSTLAKGARLAEDDWHISKSKEPRLRIEIDEVPPDTLKQTALLTGVTIPEPQSEYRWIGDLHQLVCHEVNNSASTHADRAEVDGFFVCHVRWSLVVRAGKLRVIFENAVLDDEAERAGARELAAKRGMFKRSTGLGQMRLGLTGAHDLGDLDVALFEEGDTCVYQVSVPIGNYSER